jgi:hypothetical protein
MKKIIPGTVFSYLLFIILSCLQLPGIAQDTTSTKITKETTTTTTTWYAEPWVWVVGGAVVILILVALLRGNSSRDREVTRTTVIKDQR